MTNEEIEQFKKTIQDTIIPNVINLKSHEIVKIVQEVPDISDEFKNMLLEQIFIMKEKQLKKPII